MLPTGVRVKVVDVQTRGTGREGFRAKTRLHRRGHQLHKQWPYIVCVEIMALFKQQWVNADIAAQLVEGLKRQEQVKRWRVCIRS